MRLLQAKHTVLVPVVGGDISRDTAALAREFLREPRTRLILLHVERPGESVSQSAHSSSRPASEPLWARLAAVAGPHRTFVEAVEGDPATAVAGEAERFRCDTVVVDGHALDTRRAFTHRRRHAARFQARAR